MDDVQFETDKQFKIASPSIGIVRAENKMAEWLMRRGIVKNSGQAQYTLIGVAVVAIFAAIAFWFLLSPKTDTTLRGPDPSTLVPVQTNTVPAKTVTF